MNEIKDTLKDVGERLFPKCENCLSRGSSKRELRNNNNKSVGYVYLCDECFDSISK